MSLSKSSSAISFTPAKFQLFLEIFPCYSVFASENRNFCTLEKFPVSISNPCIKMQGFLISQADGMSVIPQKRGLSHWRSMIVRAMPPLILLLDPASLQFTVLLPSVMLMLLDLIRQPYLTFQIWHPLLHRCMHRNPELHDQILPTSVLHLR